MSLCQCQNPPPTVRWRKAVQCQLSVNLYQLSSITGNSVSGLLPLPTVTKVTVLSDSSRKMLASWLSVVQISLTTNSLRQKGSWICHSTSEPFSFPCINPHALIHTVGWNQWKSCSKLELLDLSLDKPRSNKHFAVSTYAIGKKAWKDQAFPYTSWGAGTATPTTG